MMDKIERIKGLVNLLNKACDAYYNLNNPIMENREYNLLFDELKSLEESTGIILADSPTQRAGYEVVSDLPKVKHEIPLLSLDKIKKIPELIKWLENREGILMLKMDGGTGKLTYEDTSCTQLVTRGDSKTNIGEDVSHNIRSIKNIPLSINNANELQVTGEVFMKYSSFNEINAKILNPDEKFSHPRNLANGSIGLLDSKLCKERNIEFCAFNIIKGNIFKTKQEQLDWLKSQGFYTVQYWMVNKDNLEETINQIIEDIPTFDFPIDGLVLCFNNIAYGESLGFTNHHYNSGISFKFEDDWYNTTYDYTEWNTSRLGKIVPKGIFKSIKMDGADHDRATLHNLDRFRAMKLGHGDAIQTSKRNKIIPAIENNITRSNTEQIPTKCPTCGGNIEERLVVNTHDLFCLNPDCEAKLLKKLKHFVSKQCFNIGDLGEATLNTFIEEGFISSYIDIFKLEKYKKEILSLDGFALKSFNKLIEAIEVSKQIEMVNLIASIGIKNIGFGSSKRLAKYFNNNINRFLEATKSYRNFLGIEDIGETTAQDIYNYFQDEDNMNLFLELLQIVTVKKEEKKENNSKVDLTGKTFCVTGEFVSFKPRKKLEELIESLGGKLTGSVSKSTFVLLTNDTTSGTKKNQDAMKHGVRIMNEDEFLDMIK
jgi:DNA ligase (NAD+)